MTFAMRQWRPSDVLSLEKPLRPYAFIILNQKLNRIDIFKKLWSGGTLIHMCFVRCEVDQN
jgi:hypothetical protein